MYINKIFQVRKMKQMFSGYFSLDFHLIHICRICSMQCSFNGINKLFRWHISNSSMFLERRLEGKPYSEEVGTVFPIHHNKANTGLGLMSLTQQTVHATKDSIVSTPCEYANEQH